MNEFIEKNRRLLRFYCIAARIIGWFVLLVAAILVIVEVSSGGRFSSTKGLQKVFVLEGLFFSYMLPAFLALMVGDFIRYLSETEYQPGWILRYADKVFYTYSILVILNAIWRHIYFAILTAQYTDFSPSRLLYVFLFVLLTAAKVLILIGLAQILRRVMPVIEESRTLV